MGEVYSLRRVIDMTPPEEPEGYKFSELPRISHHIVTQQVMLDSGNASMLMKLFKELAMKYRESTDLSTCRVTAATVNGREVLNRMRNKMIAFNKLLSNDKILMHKNFDKLVEFYMAFGGYVTVFNAVVVDVKPFTGYHIYDVIAQSKKKHNLPQTHTIDCVTIMIRYMVNTYLKLHNQWKVFLPLYCQLYTQQLKKYNEAIRVYDMIGKLTVQPNSHVQSKRRPRRRHRR